MRAAKRALGALGALLMGLLAVAGLALSAAFVVVSTDAGRGLLIPRLVRAADDALAGRIELGAFRLRTQGGVELDGIRVLDPDGDTVLTVERALVDVDLSRLRLRTIGLRVEVDRPEVLLKREDDGSLSLGRAFAPTRPSAGRATGPGGPAMGAPEWTVRLSRLVVRDASLRYLDARGALALEARGLSLEARGQSGPRGSRIEARASGEFTHPLAAPASLEVAAGLRGGALRLPVLRVALGQSGLEVVAEGDIGARTGRAAVMRLTIDGDGVRALAPGAPLSEDLAATAYAQLDGREATLAAQVLPRGPGEGGGKAALAAAVRLPPATLAAGFDLEVDELDPSRLVSLAPPGAITLTARGRATWRTLRDLRGALALSAARSRIRGGQFGPVELQATAGDGAVEVSRLALALPGAAVQASGRLRPGGGEVSGELVAEASDLASVRRELEEILGRKLPPMAGAAKVAARAAGTAAAPEVKLEAASPALRVGDAELRDLSLRAELFGPSSAARGQIDGSIAQVIAGHIDARDVALKGHVEGRTGRVALSALVPEAGAEPFALRAEGELSEDRRRLRLAELSLSYPGTELALARPAEIDLVGPSVDRLELASGEWRLELEGGIRGKDLDASLALAALDLGRLPRGLLPRGLDLAGRVSATARVRGVAGPRGQEVRDLDGEAHLTLSGGAVLGMTGLEAALEAEVHEGTRRAVVDLGVRREAGGEVSARADLPLGMPAALPGAPVSARVALRKVPLAELARLGGFDAGTNDVAGTLDAEGTLAGTAGAPTLALELTVGEAQFQEWTDLAARARLEASGSEAQLSASADQQGERVLEAEARLPVDLGDLMVDPARALEALRTAPLEARATAPGIDLGRISGKGPVPEQLTGRLTGSAELQGSLAAPRARAALEVSDGGFRGRGRVGLRGELEAGERGLALSASATLNGEAALRAEARLGAAPEQLGSRETRESATLHVEVVIARTSLGRIDPGLEIGGEVEGRLGVDGTLAAPLAELALTGRQIAVGQTRLGDLDVSGRYGRGDGRLTARLAAPGGGSLKLEARLGADLGAAGLRSASLGSSPLEAQLVADRLDLGMLPAAAPGFIRAAEGRLDAQLGARGAAARPQLRGTVRLAASQLAISEFGEWKDIALDASLTDDAFRLERFEAHREGGVVTASAEASGLASRDAPAQLAAQATIRDLTILHAGMPLVTLEDLHLASRGKLARGDLDAEVNIPGAVVRLPKRLPTPLQPLDRRSDIAIGPQRRRAAAASEDHKPSFRGRVHLLVPNRFFVKDDDPRLNVELKADATFELDGGELAATGSIDTVHGQVEPLSGRSFTVSRGKLQFTGGPLEKANLDVSATYENPIAKVTAVISGSLTAPQLKLTSQPPLEEQQIALLLATGRTELKPGSGAVDSLTGEEAKSAAVGVLATAFFKDVVANRLPVDSVAFDSSQLRAGKYVGDKVYVGYTRRFNAQVELGENANEVRVEYQITPRWSFEMRYGDANSGGASLIWSKDY